MTAENGNGEELLKLRKAAAEDLRLLALLHGGELTAEMAAQLREGAFRELFAVVLESQLAGEAMVVIEEGIGALKDEKALDDLAADYADIYLTHRLQLSPLESPWLDEDGLVNGEPMFEVRNWYEHYGLEAENWRLRADDHMSLQMSFIAHLLDKGDVDLSQPGRFMDEHLLRWIDQFAENVAQRCATPYYAGLAMFTYAYLDELRTLIEKLTGEPRRRFDEKEEEEGAEDAAPFAPGAEPGW